MAQFECQIGSFVVLRGSGPVLLRNPIFLKFSRGGGSFTRPPSGSAHACLSANKYGHYLHLLLSSAVYSWLLVVQDSESSVLRYYLLEDRLWGLLLLPKTQTNQ